MSTDFFSLTLENIIRTAELKQKTSYVWRYVR